MNVVGLQNWMIYFYVTENFIGRGEGCLKRRMFPISDWGNLDLLGYSLYTKKNSTFVSYEM